MNGSKVVIYDVGRARCERETVDEHNIPKGHLLIRNEYSLVSAGTELACLAGLEYWFTIPGTPGYCSMGKIVGMGEGVEGWQVGDTVYSDGGHHSLVVLPAHDPSVLVKKIAAPAKRKLIPYLRMASIAFTSTQVSHIQVGDKVLVTGLGVVGNFAAQLAQLQGADVLCVELDARRRAIATQCGIRHIADGGAADFGERLAAFAGSEGIFCAIDSTGNSSVVLDTLPRVARNGEMILLGTPRGVTGADLTQILRRIHLADTNLSIRGAHEVVNPTWRNPFVKHSRERSFDILMGLLADERLIIEPMVSRVASAEEAGDVYERLRARNTDLMSVLFDWRRADCE